MSKPAKATTKTMKLSQPITVDGKEMDSITFDFMRMGSLDVIGIESEMRQDEVPFIANTLLSPAYCQYIGARLAGLNIEDFKKLNGKDTLRAIGIVQNFTTSSED